MFVNRMSDSEHAAALERAEGHLLELLQMCPPGTVIEPGEPYDSLFPLGGFDVFDEPARLTADVIEGGADA
jgi:hypothetical protein